MRQRQACASQQTSVCICPCYTCVCIQPYMRREAVTGLCWPADISVYLSLLYMCVYTAIHASRGSDRPELASRHHCVFVPVIHVCVYSHTCVARQRQACAGQQTSVCKPPCHVCLCVCVYSRTDCAWVTGRTASRRVCVCVYVCTAVHATRGSAGLYQLCLGHRTDSQQTCVCVCICLYSCTCDTRQCRSVPTVSGSQGGQPADVCVCVYMFVQLYMRHEAVQVCTNCVWVTGRTASRRVCVCVYVCTAVHATRGSAGLYQLCLGHRADSQQTCVCVCICLYSCTCDTRQCRSVPTVPGSQGGQPADVCVCVYMFVQLYMRHEAVQVCTNCAWVTGRTASRRVCVCVYVCTAVHATRGSAGLYQLCLGHRADSQQELQTSVCNPPCCVCVCTAIRASRGSDRPVPTVSGSHGGQPAGPAEPALPGAHPLQSPGLPR